MKDFKELQESILNPNNKNGIGADLQKNADIQFIKGFDDQITRLFMLGSKPCKVGVTDMCGSELHIGDFVAYIDEDRDVFFGLVVELKEDKVIIYLGTGANTGEQDNPFSDSILHTAKCLYVIKLANRKDVKQILNIMLNSRK